MQKLPEIKASYDWFFMHYQDEVKEVARTNNIAALNRMEAKRDILERGIFVLMFGQFEMAVNSQFESACYARATNPDWTRRRGWDTVALGGRKITFETKLAMVLDRRSQSFKRIIQTFQTRNHCATAEPQTRSVRSMPSRQISIAGNAN